MPVIVQLSPTKVLPEKISFTEFPVTNPVNVPLPLALNTPPASVVKVNVPFNCPSVVRVPERVIVIAKFPVVKIIVLLTFAPVWLKILTEEENPEVSLFRGFWQFD